MRSRIDAAFAAADVNAIARDCLGLGSATSSQAPLRKTGIDDGVPLSCALQNALQCLTSDRWRINFVQRRKYFAPRLQNLDLPSSCVVMPFSDGLDSHMVAALLRREHGDSLVPVRLESKSSGGTRRRTARARVFASMPWRVSYGDTGSVEPSARSRGFTFALLSGIAAFLCKSRRIALPESGQGALGPPLVPVGQAHADLRSHPSLPTGWRPSCPRSSVTPFAMSIHASGERRARPWRSSLRPAPRTSSGSLLVPAGKARDTYRSPGAVVNVAFVRRACSGE